MSAEPKLRFGEFDDAWVEAKVNEFAETKTGSRDTQNRITGGLYPFYVRSDTIERINSYDFDGEAVLTSGDGVGVGKNIHYVNEKFDYHQRVYAIRNFIDEVSGKFFFQFFKEHFYKRVMRLSAKNSVDSVRMSMITDMVMPCPSLPEQKKIADFLGAVDDKIAGLRERESLLTQYKKGVMQKIFTQNLRFKADDGSDFPDWEVVRLGDVSSIQTGKTPSTSNPSLWVGDIPFVTPTDITDGKYVQAPPRNVNKGSGAKVVKAGSIAYTCIASIGKMGMLESNSATNQQINAVTVNSNHVAEYIYYQLLYLTPRIRKLPASTTLPIINKTEFSAIKFDMPRPAEQQKIADFLSAIDAKITAVSAQIAQMQDFKKGLLQRMFV